MPSTGPHRARRSPSTRGPTIAPMLPHDGWRRRRARAGSAPPPLDSPLRCGKMSHRFHARGPYMEILMKRLATASLAAQLLTILPALAAILLLTASPALFADEGMWTFDNFPKKAVKDKYGFDVTNEWLDHVRLSSARLAGGCSGSFVSGDGLVM